MTLQEYMRAMRTFIKEHPEAKKLQVITSADDEGNYFNPVYYTPGLAKYTDGECTPTKIIGEANAVLLN